MIKPINLFEYKSLAKQHLSSMAWGYYSSVSLDEITLAVLVGRPILWGLAINGEADVSHVLELLKDELSLAITLSGCPSITEINNSFFLKM